MLCVDLDGCLVRTDTLVETLFLFVRRHPLRTPLILFWLFGGKARFKSRLAAEAGLDASLLPYHPEVLDYIRARREAGGRVVLATGSDQRTAAAVAAHLGLFDEVHASDGRVNLTGSRKAELLAARYPDFEYMGDSRTDLAVWRRAQSAVVVSSDAELRSDVERLGIPVRVMAAEGKSHEAGFTAWVHVLRVYQWVKNLLVFLPVLTAHRVTDQVAVRHAWIAFLAYCCAASGTYLLNDLFDLAADRAHPRKRGRPFASGELNLLAGAVTAVLLFVAGFGFAWMLPNGSLAVLLGYVVLTLAYSVWLKQFAVVDVLMLVCFYLLRILAGGVATGIMISFWLLAFSMFFFLALALVKRLMELRTADFIGTGRGYRITDVQLLASLAGSIAYLSVVLLALYINSAEVHVLYRQPQLLWPICLVIVYWLSRVVLFANRGELDDDPLVFASRDHVSWFAGAAVVLFLYLAH